MSGAALPWPPLASPCHPDGNGCSTRRNPGTSLRRLRRPYPTRQPEQFLDDPRILAGREGNREVVSLNPPGLEPTWNRRPPESPRPQSGIRRTAYARSRAVPPPPDRPRSSSVTWLLCHPSWRSRVCRATFNLKFAFSSRMSPNTPLPACAAREHKRLGSECPAVAAPVPVDQKKAVAIAVHDASERRRQSKPED